MRRVHILGMLLALSAIVTITIAAPIKIGVVWSGKSGTATKVCDGFTETIATLMPEAEVEYQKDVASIEDLGALVTKWQKEKNGVVVLRSNGAQWLIKNPPVVPTFVGACNNPVELGVVKSLTSPDGKITGCSYYIPVKNQFATFKAMLPNMKNVVLLVDETNPSGPVDKNETEAAAKEMGLGCKVVACVTPEDAVNAVKAVTDKNTAIVLGNQALLFDNAEAIVAAGATVPILTYNAKPVDKGALGGFVADDVKLGKLLAQSVTDVVKNGKPLSAVPIKLDTDPKLRINITTASALGITIPLNIIKRAETVK